MGNWFAGQEPFKLYTVVIFDEWTTGIRFYLLPTLLLHTSSWPYDMYTRAWNYIAMYMYVHICRTIF